MHHLCLGLHQSQSGTSGWNQCSKFQMITNMSIKHKTECIKMEKKFYFDGKGKTVEEKELLLTVIQLLINTSPCERLVGFNWLCQVDKKNHNHNFWWLFAFETCCKIICQAMAIVLLTILDFFAIIGTEGALRELSTI